MGHAERAGGWLAEPWSGGVLSSKPLSRHVVMSRAAEERQQEALAGPRARGAKMGAR